MNMKKSELLQVWPLLKDGKFGKVSGEGKIKYVKMLATLSPVVKEFESYRETVVEKLMSQYDGFNEKLADAQAYEAYIKDSNQEPPKMTEDEYKAFLKIVQEYNKSVVDALNEEGSKDVDVKFEKLTPTEFGCFCDSNDFTGEQALMLADIMCDMD